MTTTEETGRRFRLFRRSTRARMLSWFILLMTIALVGSLAVTANLLMRESRASIEDDIERELAAFRSFSQQALDPETGKPFSTAASVLTQYLATAVTSNHELLFSVVDGKPGERTRGPAALRLDRDPAFVKKAATATAPVSGTMTTAAGLIAYAIMPVAVGDEGAGNALVVVEHMQPVIDETAENVRSIGFISLFALILASLVSWIVTARLVKPMRHVLETAQEIDSGDLSTRIVLERGAADDVVLLADNFNRMLDRLEKAFATQRQFLDDAAHELRTPLTVIRGNLELSGGHLSEHERLLLLDEIDRMNRLVDDLLFLARSQQPNFLELERVDLADLVLGVAAKAQFLGRRKWDVPELLSGTITADGQRLTQALMQLTANAVAATEEIDRVWICSRRSNDGRFVELIVADGGEGVPPEMVDHIFTRFYGGRRDGLSSGLGLSIVRQIAVSHGGSVRVEDSPMGGASFVISLPIDELDAQIDDAGSLDLAAGGHHAADGTAGHSSDDAVVGRHLAVGPVKDEPDLMNEEPDVRTA
ncbi:MAG: HAMP domain-containing sensor histidine kinase [Ancrocorticia sp.]